MKKAPSPGANGAVFASRSTKLRGISLQSSLAHDRMAIADDSKRGVVRRISNLGLRALARNVRRLGDPALDARVTLDPVASCSSSLAPASRGCDIGCFSLPRPKSRSRPTGPDRKALEPLDCDARIVSQESIRVKRQFVPCQFVPPDLRSLDFLLSEAYCGLGSRRSHGIPPRGRSPRSPICDLGTLPIKKLTALLHHAATRISTWNPRFRIRLASFVASWVGLRRGE